MRKGRGPEGVIFDTQKNEQAIIEMLHRHSRMTFRAMSGGLIHPIDDTHVCKKEDNFRMQLHSLLLIEL